MCIEVAGAGEHLEAAGERLIPVGSSERLGLAYFNLVYVNMFLDHATFDGTYFDTKSSFNLSGHLMHLCVK